MNAAEEKAVLSLAAVVATVPVPFPVFGDATASAAMATKGRLDAAVGRLSALRLDSVRAGLREIAPRVIGGGHHETVVNVAVAARSRGADVLKAPLALAIATLSAKFDPSADSAAELWLSFAERYARRTVG
ncbi:hypothetical protein [Amycolatopsis sp. DG1A-15b]|uniref:hypothetical protein n=1 Tax=Amycolatopsis sp. DG1A-15b TaxID=3052846 RepID=UPI00255BF8F0|nr:hypothetical protein [Amycolatopsis sp. DG1A-15b]WIX91330.1 hypothetical protein QRY02_13110 [Amycolatopsis sp. DG1A-15b]